MLYSGELIRKRLTEISMKQIPKIEKYMTPMPHTIGQSIPLEKALDLMRTHRIRHLPVQEAGKLVGILTDRDIKLASSFATDTQLRVEDVMTPEPYTVKPGTPLDSVVLEMAEQKYGCAIIAQDNGKVVGIFTAVDGLRVLSEILHQNYRAVS
jgi:acetoin utilization protein AcuB